MYGVPIHRLVQMIREIVSNQVPLMSFLLRSWLSDIYHPLHFLFEERKWECKIEIGPSLLTSEADSFSLARYCSKSFVLFARLKDHSIVWTLAFLTCFRTAKYVWNIDLIGACISRAPVMSLGHGNKSIGYRVAKKIQENMEWNRKKAYHDMGYQ